MKIFFFLIIAIIVGIPTLLFNSFVLEHLWRWFAPIDYTLTFKQCLGIFFILNFLKYYPPDKSKKTQDEIISEYSSKIFSIFLYAALTLLFGYIWHLVLLHHVSWK